MVVSVTCEFRGRPAQTFTEYDAPDQPEGGEPAKITFEDQPFRFLITRAGKLILTKCTRWSHISLMAVEAAQQFGLALRQMTKTTTQFKCGIPTIN